jgi:hypothetical protein
MADLEKAKIDPDRDATLHEGQEAGDGSQESPVDAENLKKGTVTSGGGNGHDPRFGNSSIVEEDGYTFISFGPGDPEVSP